MPDQVTLYEVQEVKGSGKRVLIKRYGRLSSAYSHIDTTAKRIQRKFKRQQVGMAVITYTPTDNDGCHAFIDLQVKAHQYRRRSIHRHYVIVEVAV